MRTCADVDRGGVLSEHSGLLAVRDLDFAELHFELVLLRAEHIYTVLKMELQKSEI